MFDESEGRDHWLAFYANSLDMLMIKIQTAHRKLLLVTEFQRFGDHKVEISQKIGFADSMVVLRHVGSAMYVNGDRR